MHVNAYLISTVSNSVIGIDTEFDWFRKIKRVAAVEIYERVIVFRILVGKDYKPEFLLLTLHNTWAASVLTGKESGLYISRFSWSI